MTKIGGADLRLHPVILSGGSGTRLWPLSRELYPKQLLPLVSERSLIQDTASRVAGADGFAPPLVICNEEHRFIIAEQLRQIEIEPSAIVLEPVGRNTAPAVAVAAMLVARETPDALLLVLSSDHAIDDADAFRAAARTAAGAARDGALVTFGIAPARAETSYGYIRRGPPVDGHEGVHAVEKFVEKPDRATAEGYLAAGDYYWNSGMFVFAALRYLEELERYDADMVAACREAVDGAERDLDFLRIEAGAFARIEGQSIDYAVMETTQRAAVVPVEFGWSDVGSWSALWDIGDKAADGNVVLGDAVLEAVTNSYIRSDARLVAALGLDGMVIVVTDDTVFVAPRDRAQDVKLLVERLKKDGRPEPVTHSTVYRPWGHYQTIDIGERFQVKRITVKPGAQLSLQKHFHRAEHWVVVNGTAKVTRGADVILLEENQSTYIPLGTVHRLENPGKVPLNLIEVQSGAYLGEDDIVRLEDDYGRDA